MKNLIAVLLISFAAHAGVQARQDISGAWKLTDGENQHLLLFQNGFACHTVYKGNQFVMTNGGNFWIKGDSIHVFQLFNSADSSKVNQKMIIPFSVSGGMLSLNLPEGNVKFERIDEGKAPLAALWVINGRMGDDGKVVQIHHTGTRQTYKLLTGTKFQWVAIDPAKKEFYGTGGGSYTYKDGKYTENIEFFSRDNTRAGTSLVFDCKLENGQWHHSGLSSKGAKIYEIWGTLVFIPPPGQPKSKFVGGTD